MTGESIFFYFIQIWQDVERYGSYYNLYENLKKMKNYIEDIESCPSKGRNRQVKISKENYTVTIIEEKNKDRILKFLYFDDSNFENYFEDIDIILKHLIEDYFSEQKSNTFTLFFNIFEYVNGQPRYDLILLIRRLLYIMNKQYFSKKDKNRYLTIIDTYLKKKTKYSRVQFLSSWVKESRPKRCDNNL